VGENTENELVAKAGTLMTVTIHQASYMLQKRFSSILTSKQVNADGAGPYTCD
jgi:hypothetical protein